MTSNLQMEKKEEPKVKERIFPVSFMTAKSKAQIKGDSGIRHNSINHKNVQSLKYGN